VAAVIKVIWRDWYDDAAVAALTKLGTLPRNEAEVEAFMTDGEDAARMIAEQLNSFDGEQFREGGTIVILEPEDMAGTYEISVDYEPTFYATKED
jgi:hypothetical protein